MKFYFQALTQAGRPISGVIEAADKDKAHDQLAANKMAILSLSTEQTDQSGVENMEKFEFLAQNEMGKNVRGTIEAIDDFAAFRKLTISYELKVKYLFPVGLSVNDQADLKKDTFPPPEWQERIEMEQAKKEKKQKVNTTVSDEEQLKQEIARHAQEMAVVRQEIDETLKQIKPLLQQCQHLLNPGKKRSIESHIDLLERLKHSNSIDHLRNLTKRILREVGDEDIFLKEIAEGKAAEIDEQKKAFQTISSTATQKIDKGLRNLQLKMAGLDTQEIKVTIKHLHPLLYVFELVEKFFIALSALMGLYWLWAVIWLNLTNSAMSKFYVSSSTMLYITGLLSILWAIKYMVRRLNLSTNQEKILVTAGSVGIVLVYSLYYPAVWFWAY